MGRADELDGIQAAWLRYAFVLAGLAVLVLAGLAASWPAPYGLVVEHVILPRYEDAFGFRGGRLVVGPAGHRQSVYGIVSATEGGRMNRAGVRAGDIPVGVDRIRNWAEDLLEVEIPDTAIERVSVLASSARTLGDVAHAVKRTLRHHNLLQDAIVTRLRG